MESLASKNFHPHRNALFVVSNDSVLENLATAREYAQFDPMIVSEPAYALNDNQIRYGAIYIGSNISSVPLIPLLKKARYLYPSTGIYLMGPPSFSEAEVKGMGLQGVIPFPKSLKDLPISPLLSAEVLEEAKVAPAKKAQVRNPARTPDEAKKFAEIPIEDFFSGERLPFDTFVRLGAGHYVKVANAGSFLERSRLIKFVIEGTGSLYIERVPYLKCLAFYDYLSANLMALPGISTEVKMCHLAATARALENVTGAAALTPEKQLAATNVLKDLYTFVTVEEKAMPKVVQLFLSQTDLFTHASSVAFACAILSRPLKYQSERPKMLLGQAALFHDVGMALLPRELQNEDERSWSVAAREKYQGHAKLGAQLLAEAKFDQAVVQAVLYHHERKNSLTSASVRVSPLAELVGIADELVAEVMKLGDPTPLDQRIELLERKLIDAFSPETLAAFRVCFGSERRKP